MINSTQCLEQYKIVCSHTPAQHGVTWGTTALTTIIGFTFQHWKHASLMKNHIAGMASSGDVEMSHLGQSAGGLQLGSDSSGVVLDIHGRGLDLHVRVGATVLLALIGHFTASTISNHAMEQDCHLEPIGSSSDLPDGDG